MNDTDLFLFPDTRFITLFCEYGNFVPEQSSISWRDTQTVLQDGISGNIAIDNNLTQLVVALDEHLTYTCFQIDEVGILALNFYIYCKKIINNISL